MLVQIPKGFEELPLLVSDASNSPAVIPVVKARIVQICIPDRKNHRELSLLKIKVSEKLETRSH